jgi:DNA-directed RNA polymerase specialized sigma24 family protein
VTFPNCETTSRTGDSAVIASFERDVVPLRVSLLGHALRITRNCVDAEDLLQETMVKAVYYADVAGFTCQEIAEIMGTPVGTVTSRLNRGRRRLRKLLANAARERGYALEPRERSP